MPLATCQTSSLTFHCQAEIGGAGPEWGHLASRVLGPAHSPPHPAPGMSQGLSLPPGLVRPRPAPCPVAGTGVWLRPCLWDGPLWLEWFRVGSPPGSLWRPLQRPCAGESSALGSVP